MAKIFKDTNAIDSLRSSDFDAVSAYGEVIDNAIEAGAKVIKIRTKMKPRNNGYFLFEQIMFGDDGSGMDSVTLENCLTIGWSSRYNSRDGIGRFGVGMTLAAIHECKKVEVYSKKEGGQWLYTYLDLDKISSGDQDELPAPEPRNPGSDLLALTNPDHGTIVVWSKYDRQSDNATKLMDEARVWIGRTYRYFFWENGVSIEIDGQPVRVIDPLYRNLSLSEYPEDPVADVYHPIEIDWPVDAFDAPPNAPDESRITVHMSLLPAELRPEKGAGGWEASRKRFIHENEGISILRNKREVFYGHIPYWSAAGKGWSNFENIDRWWGCEIHFDAILDRAFTVKNIKRGAVPNKELKQKIKELIQPTRETCLRKIRDLWATNEHLAEKQKAADEEGAKRPGQHEKAEKIAKATPTDKNKLDEDKDFDHEADDLLKRLGDQYDDQQKAALKALFADQPFSIMEQSWNGPQFFESHHLGGQSVLDYNMRHEFFESVYGVLNRLEDDDNDPYELAAALKQLLDLLLIAFAKAEARFGRDEEMDADSFLDLLRSNWGQYLKSYVKTWKRTREYEEQ